MNYGQFLNMMPEALLVLWLLIVFVADFSLMKSERKVSVLGKLTATLLLCQTILMFGIQPSEAFGGLYVSSAAVNVMKTILAFGTFIVVMMAQSWVETRKHLAGEFYMLILATLLGMYVMMSSGNFLLFFLGLETASVPLACMVAFDKDCKNSAEGAAKYILVATFSSGVMLFGISFIYAATGTLYFDDVAAVVTAKPLTIMGLVFFFSGLGFKISLVPFHFWTADTYQGAPTPVTGYLSVISKGAAAITLCTILMKVFQPMVEYWDYMLYVVIVLSITVANLFAIRQSELKRFMAFSSISQAGYIMLAVVGNNQLGIAALTYYVLVYIVANMAVFTVINVVERNNAGRTDMAAYNGFYQTNPKLSFLMTLALFSLAGIPPFAGMFSKFFVFMAGVQNGEPLAYFVVFIALVNTVVSLYYYLLIVKAMYITKTDSPLPTFQSDVNTKMALAICTAGIALFGVVSCIYEWIAAAGM
ncbi:NADH-quinone oxidoreductase subunit N [Xylanibacter ruminicola]|uniref:NADH-quinone oxidoreductase subunit N n=1 Tax=Xylanibacter ruminicola TaxID=839 RepID=A0A1H5UF56_XYLRU|nr:NADH-quinone oxidoreductase subunit N [Xylanibacter ruminicola]SEF73660.1 NADH-quinone oxidoreductase subunit N [Xylanibacter ruminicola]